MNMSNRVPLRYLFYKYQVHKYWTFYFVYNQIFAHVGIFITLLGYRYKLEYTKTKLLEYHVLKSGYSNTKFLFDTIKSYRVI